MAEARLWVRTTPRQKRAIRILAAKANMNMSEYVLSILEHSTPFNETLSSDEVILNVGQNDTQSGHRRDRR
jgi:hypothetical protein